MSLVTPSEEVNRISVPSLFPTPPPFAVVFRLASVTETNTGKSASDEEPETLVWSIVTGLR